MKKQLFLLILFLIGRSTITLFAQEKIVKITDLVLAKETTQPNQSVVSIYSPIEQLTIKSNMGDECKEQPTIESDGTYKYTLVIQFSTDELEGGRQTFRRNIKIDSDYGQTELPCRLAPGKQYTCNFTVPPEFAYSDESVSGGIFASDKARISISSRLKDLNIYYNEIQVLKQGQIETSLPSYLSIEKDQDNYYFLFSLEGNHINQESFKRPTFKIQHTTDEGDSNELEIQLKENTSIGPKANFKYRVFYKNIVSKTEVIVEARDLSFDELLQKAQQLEEKHNFLAAANTYQNARDHINCPLERKPELLELKKKAANSEGYMRIIQKYENKLGEIIQTLGFEHESAYECCRMIVLANQKLSSTYPSDKQLAEDLEAAQEQLYKHPQSKRTSEKTVSIPKQQIYGTVTKDNSYTDDIAGTEIYTISSDQYKAYLEKETHKERKKYLKAEKKAKRLNLVGRVSSDNTYRIKLDPEKSYHALYFCGQLELSYELFLITPETHKLDIKLK